MTRRRRTPPPRQITIPARCPTCDGTGELQVLDGQYLRQVRVERGLSMRALGGLAKVSAGFICDLERGFRLARPATLERLRQALGIAAVVR